jgi:CDP-diacylglycerol---glycerol-3-phosphate 3-phosphatidyltransferase
MPLVRRPRVTISVVGCEHKELGHAEALAGRSRGPLVCGMSRESLVTLPNAVSMSRLLLAAAFVAVRDPVIRFSLLLVASATDFLDGWLARRRHATTKSGALIDPIADRLFVFTAVSVYLLEGAISAGAYFTLLARDIATFIGFLVARSVPWLRAVVFRARLLGKLVTVLQLLTLLAVIVAPSVVPLLVLAVGLVSAASIADYTLALWRERAT